MTATLHVRQTVESYEDWKPAFDGHESSRRLHGASKHRVLRDGNNVTVLIDFPDRAAAEGFGADPSLREVMSKAGVIGAPDITLLEPVEEITY
jgi:hypothetical protein